MLARKLFTGMATVAVSVTALALTSGPASAAFADPDDTNDITVPGATTDLIGVGSDTTQHAVKLLADAYNATSPAAKIVSWSATGGGNIPLPDASSIARPINSGNGKTLLYNPSNANIDFARSSSAENTAEQNAGLQSFPFAVDTLEMVKSGNVASHAPASLTIQQILGIYTGTITNWNQVGGTAGVIKPLRPNDGSGTLSFFTAQLVAANGGAPVVFAGSVTSVQEHDPAPIESDADAIAPFSLAKQKTLANPARIAAEPGFTADRAVYNVVRGADVGRADVLAAFGSNGFVCSAAGKTQIEAAGFRQLLPPAKGGVCGQPTNQATSNLATQQVATTTTVTVTSASGSSARITAAVKGAGTNPSDGTVAFFEGSTQLASGVPLISGQAARIQATTSGTHSYRAVYTPAANSVFLGSEGSGTGTVSKAASTIKTDFPKSVTLGKKIKGTVTVTLSGSSSKATGTVKVMNGKKVVGTGTLKNGVAKIKLKLTKAGTYKLVASWGGDASGNDSSAKFKVKVVKPKK
jgi:ABC-type phosphate transport system substrate-binding protein